MAQNLSNPASTKEEQLRHEIALRLSKILTLPVSENGQEITTNAGKVNAGELGSAIFDMVVGAMTEICPARVLVEVEGGVVQTIQTTMPQLVAYLFDHDNAKSSEAEEDDKFTLLYWAKRVTQTEFDAYAEELASIYQEEDEAAQE